MGEVFLAEHLQLGRKEALKILMPLLARDPVFVHRFRREARAVNRLRHPNIVALYDFGQLPDGRFYLAMEYADGQPLGRVYRSKAKVEIPRALHILGQLVQAVHHAHSRGVVHRDLKPDNLVLVGPHEHVKVLDFGLAKIVAPDHDESLALSGERELWGTPSYIAPERVSGIGDDPRSDLYAIGCMAYEMLVGEPPFRGTPADVVYAHVTKAPDPLAALRPGEIPDQLESVVQRCLEKDPARRFQSPAELFAALRAVPGFPSRRVESRRRFVPAGSEPPPRSEYGDVRGALRRLAEALLDRGVTDPRLVGGAAILRDHEQIVARLEAVQDALEHETTALRETLLEREASLRFALGELGLVSNTPHAPAGVQELVRELETRLAAVAEESERLRASEQHIEAIAATRVERLAKLQTAYEALGAVVSELIPEHLEDDTIHALAAKLAAARHSASDGA
jgi:hypothetical protein